MRSTCLSALAVVPVAMLGLSGCGSDSDTGQDDAGTVEVTESDFSLELGKTSAPAGKVTFAVHNDGPSVHEFVVFKTDLAPDALPKDDNGDVAESDTFAPVDEIEDIAKGADPTLEVDLAAGKYVVICNLPGHYRQGMSASLTVT
jgi:uncharacterized cupredoxin-like copper-binding protein